MIAILHIMKTIDKDCVEIGFCTNKEYRKKGYMQEALNAFVSFLRKETATRKIIATSYSHNLASNNLLRKIGFKEVVNRQSIHIHHLLGEVTILFYELHLK